MGAKRKKISEECETERKIRGKGQRKEEIREEEN